MFELCNARILRITMLLMVCAVHHVHAQPLDSVHVYRTKPNVMYSTGSATELAWKYEKERADHRTVKGVQLQQAMGALESYTPTHHQPGRLLGLSNVAIAFIGGTVHVYGVTEDLDRIYNFTTRVEYRINSVADHIRVRALLARVLMDLK